MLRGQKMDRILSGAGGGTLTVVANMERSDVEVVAHLQHNTGAVVDVGKGHNS